MQTIQPTAAADSPADYLDQLYMELPRLYANGGTQADVEAVFGGVGTALHGALDVPHGTDVDIRMFPLPYGWAPDYEPDRGVAFDLAHAGVDLTDPRPEFRFGEWLGLILVPAAEAGRWQRWNPATGPAPKPADGHMLVTLVLLRTDSPEVTVCHLREIFGRDKSLRGPLYKPAMKLAPASAAESARLVVTLRSLLATSQAS
jgi:hypothetical protein